MGRFLRRSAQGGLAGQRKKVEDALRKRDKKPIIVVLDDIDRLSVSEIRDIFKLVRLTASFPNLIYVVVCDRFRVEQALDETGTARDKTIWRKSFNCRSICRKSRAICSRKQTSRLRSNAPWPTSRIPVRSTSESGPVRLLESIIRPLIRNMRDVRRYAIAAIHGNRRPASTARVAHADVLGLEAVRVVPA